jgi:hypothetical protein
MGARVCGQHVQRGSAGVGRREGTRDASPAPSTVAGAHPSGRRAASRRSSWSSSERRCCDVTCGCLAVSCEVASRRRERAFKSRRPRAPHAPLRSSAPRLAARRRVRAALRASSVAAGGRAPWLPAAALARRGAHAASAHARARGATPPRTRSSAAAASTQGPPRSACNTKKVSSRESASACSAARAPASGTRARQPRTPATHRQHGRPRLIRVHGGRRLGRCVAVLCGAAQLPAGAAVSISSVQREWTARARVGGPRPPVAASFSSLQRERMRMVQARCHGLHSLVELQRLRAAQRRMHQLGQSSR